MAESATLGKLFVDLLLRDEQFKKGLDDSGKALKRQGKNIDAYARVVSGLLVGALKAATAASAGLLAASAAVGAGFEKQMDAVAAVRGIASETSGEFRALEEQARSLGSTTAFSATEAAQGMEALARAGLETNEIIAASETALKLAGAGQIELGRSAEILAGTMAQFGLSAGETTRIADVFTAATQSTLFGTEDLAQAMKFAGTVGAAFGKDIEETTAAVAQFRNLGLEGTMAGTQFRMMMAKAAAPTKQAQEVLAEYKLTIEDINPETQSFAQILQNVGKAGVSTADALEIFGTKAGANVAKLSRQFAESTDDYDKLLGTLRTAAEEGTLTSETYGKMTDNVLGRLAELRSVVEETMLSLFERFRVPLTNLLTALVGFVGAVAEELGVRGGEIGTNFEDIFGRLTTFIEQNTAVGAKAFADFIVTMQSAAIAILPIITGFGSLLAAVAPLLPLLDDMAIVLGTIFAAQKAAAIATFVAGLYSTITAAGGATAALTAMGTALVGATGGIAAITAAIAVLIAGLGMLIKRNMDAASATRDLRSAQEELAKREETLSGQFLARAQERLVVTKEQILAEKEAAGQSGKLSEARAKEIDTLLSLNDATAAQKLRTGELIEVGEGVRTVSGLLAEGADGFAVVEKEIEKVARQLQHFEKRVDESSGATREYAEERVKEWQNRLFALRGSIAGARIAQQKQNSTMENARDILADLAAGTDEASESTEDLQSNQERFAEAVASKMRSLQNELRSIGLSDSEAEAERLRRKREEVEQFFEQQIASEQAQGDRLVELRQQQTDALALVDEIGRRESVERIEGIEEKAIGVLSSLRQEEMSEAEKLAIERDAVLADLAEASGEVREQIAEEYAKRIAAIEEESVPESLQEKTTAALRKVGDAFAKAGKSAISFGASVGKAASKAFKSLQGVVEQISGFGGIDLTSIAEQALGAVSDAAEKAREEAESAALAGGASEEQAAAAGEKAAAAAAEGFDLTEAALEFVDTLISQAVELTEALVSIVGPVLERLAEEIPKLIEVIIEALPQIATALAEQLPKVVQAIVENIGPLVVALIDAAQQIIVALVQKLPMLVETLLAQLPMIITRLAESIPVILTAIVDALPLILQAIVDAIPPILRAVIDAIPVIVVALAEAIPQLLTSILLAIPQIIEAVVSMLPHLISTIVGMIPDVVLAFTKALPDLMAAVISLIPTVMISIVSAIPEIVFALLESLFTQLIPMLPKMVGQFFKAIVEGMGKAVKAIADAIWQGIKDSLNIFKKKNKDAGGSAFTGMSYVPATMRMTVHQGEAIVPADRNAQMARGTVAPAPAGASQNGMGSMGGGDRPIDIAVMAEGRLLDAVQVVAAKRGHATGVVKEIRRAGGVRVGLSRGRFSAFSSR